MKPAQSCGKLLQKTFSAAVYQVLSKCRCVCKYWIQHFYLASNSKTISPITELISLIEKMRAESSEADTNGEVGGEGLRHRRKSHSSSNGTAPASEGQIDCAYTPEQLAAVKRFVNMFNTF